MKKVKKAMRLDYDFGAWFWGRSKKSFLIK
jgi:hypothetical protein